MSGGAKKKPSKAQGWEEAGSEFYQESYPAAEELDLFQKDPQHLTTLLPSKQTRAVTTIQATMRMRTNRSTTDRTMRRQATLRSKREATVHRRASTTQDVQVSMLPDLSENISNEQTIWEEIMQIKAMPIPMAQKKEMKSKILNQPNLRLQGYEQFKWKRRKLWKKFRSRLGEIYDKLGLWKGALKTIEGRYGTGVVSYFLFLKWLLFLNIFSFLLVFLFVTLPVVLSDGTVDSINNNTRCFAATDDDDDVITTLKSPSIFDYFQGTGLIKCTYLFYGFYPEDVAAFLTDRNYNLPLAYVTVILIYLLIFLISMVKNGARGFKERLIEGEGQFYLYCNLVFGGWDFCIHDVKSAGLKHESIYNEIRGSLAAEKIRDERINRTRNEKFKLYLVRFLVNVVVFGILFFCGGAIYFVFGYCSERLKNKEIVSYDEIERMFYEFLPSVTIVVMNTCVPFVFRHLVTFERYTPVFVLRLTLIRVVFVRLASLIILYATLYDKIGCNVKNNTNKEEEGCRPNVDCWETYVGQQIFKLYLTDFAVSLFVTFFVNFPRSLLGKHFKNNKFISLTCAQSFDLSKHVLDVVYSQTLCWVGCFYAPLLSGIAVLQLFLMFYIKKFACLVNSTPTGTIYRVSRSNSMFMMVMLVSFVFASVPLAFSLSRIKPSDDCGPFKHAPYVWFTIERLFGNTPELVRSSVGFLTTAGFAVPTMVLLVFLLYYYTTVNSANRHMVKVLKNQLVLEGHDKQFLLERLSMFIKQQQENQKRMRRLEMAQEVERNRSST